MPSSPLPKLRMTLEHTQRELLASVNILHHAEQRGFDWSLESIHHLDPGAAGELLVTPFFYDGGDYDRFLHQQPLVGSTLVNLMYEQFNVANSVDYLVPERGFAREQVVHCAWGDRTRNLLVDHGVSPDQIRVTGQPRFDLYTLPSLLQGREVMAARFSLDPAKQWVLLPYNFNVAYIGERRVAGLAQRGFTITPAYIEAAARARDIFTGMVRELCDGYPDTEFILRTHPSGMEAAALYGDDEARRRNLHVIAELDIANWITQASLVVVWTSSSGIEAMVAGVPVVALEPEPYAEVFDYDVTRILPSLSDPGDVAHLVGGGADVELDYDWELFDHWFVDRGGTTASRLVDLFVELAGDTQHRVDSLPHRPSLARIRRRGNAVAEDLPHVVRPLLRRLGWAEDPADLALDPQALRAAVSTLDSAPIADVLM